MPLLYICFQILCAVLIVNVVVLTITEGRPRDQTDAEEHVPHLTTNITGSQSSANVLKRSKRQGLKRLSDYCPLSSGSSGPYSNPCVKVVFTCYGYTDTVCETSHASCGRAIPTCHYAKCEHTKNNIISISINGQKRNVIQNENCRCASSCPRF